MADSRTEHIQFEGDWTAFSPDRLSDWGKSENGPTLSAVADLNHNQGQSDWAFDSSSDYFSTSGSDDFSGDQGVSPIGEWFDIADLILVDPPIEGFTGQLSLLIVIVCMAIIAFLWRDFLAMFRWGMRYSLAAFAEEVHIAEESGLSRTQGFIRGALRGAATGVVGMSPLGEASAERLNRK